MGLRIKKIKVPPAAEPKPPFLWRWEIIIAVISLVVSIYSFLVSQEILERTASGNVQLVSAKGFVYYPTVRKLSDSIKSEVYVVELFSGIKMKNVGGSTVQLIDITSQPYASDSIEGAIVRIREYVGGSPIRIDRPIMSTIQAKAIKYDSVIDYAIRVLGAKGKEKSHSDSMALQMYVESKADLKRQYLLERYPIMHLQNTIINPNEVKDMGMIFEVLYDPRKGNMEEKFKNIKFLFTFSNGQVLPVIPFVFRLPDSDR